MALLEGTKCNLGGRDFIVPPLNIKALRILGPRFAELQSAAECGNLAEMFQGEKLDTLLDVVHAAISRNYPEVTREELEDLVDLGNLEPVFRAVCAQSGMQKGAPKGEAAGPKRR
jgi:hypothetical protein